MNSVSSHDPNIDGEIQPTEIKSGPADSTDTIASPASGRPYNILNIYNPANQTKQELIENFVVRIKELNEIFQVIKSDLMEVPPRHFIIQGQRGKFPATRARIKNTFSASGAWNRPFA